MGDLRWLKPGMRFKRWIFLIFVGALMAAFGVQMAFGPALNSIWTGLYLLWSRVGALLDMTPNNISWFLGVIVFVLGVFVLVYGIRRLLRSVSEVLFSGKNGEFIDYYLTQRELSQGPKVVVIGGGTGLSTLLRGLKEYTSNITAIVTVADNGGSSGRLRNELGTLPPGDIRSCLVALADAEPLMKKLFQYRFGPQLAGLEGHSFGNIFIATMSEITGDFEAAVRESSRVLAVRGQVLPSTLEDVSLVAHFTDGTSVEGESEIPLARKTISRIELKPAGVSPPAEAVEAIKEADLIVLGPGSLYTSVVPNILVPEIRRAITTARAPVVYVCNIMTQPGETDGYSVLDHLDGLSAHLGKGVVDYVVANQSEFPPEVIEKYAAEGAEPVRLDDNLAARRDVTVLTGNFAQVNEHVRHSPLDLAGFLLNLLQ
ncbi:MAG: YvcK family protein [Firmicutes bacterium]|nr:YvcK family protein [Bacillota bacterium]